MTEASLPQELTYDQYRWLMQQLKLGNGSNPEDLERVRTLLPRHNDSIPDSQEPERIAYHEAGHAVAGHLLGSRVSRVAMGGVNLGETSWTDPSEFGPGVGPPLLLLCNWVAVRVAGSMAEEIKWGRATAPEKGLISNVSLRIRKLPPTTDETSPEVKEAIRSLTQGRTLDLFGFALAITEQAESRAKTLLREQWPTVQRLAEELLTNGKVSGDRLASILAEVRSEPVLDHK